MITIKLKVLKNAKKYLVKILKKLKILKMLRNTKTKY